MSKGDVIIIGGGLGGLECGAVLSREGFRVRVVERGHTIGGCLQTFRRHGHDLDTGMHYVGGLDEGQIMNQYLKWLGVRDMIDVERMDSAAFDTVVLENEPSTRGPSTLEDFALAMGYEGFAATLSERFPTEAAGIAKFCALMQKIGGTMSLDGLRRGVISAGAMPYMDHGAARTIDETVADPTLRAILAGTSPLYGGIRDKTTLYHYGMINHSFIESSWRFVGGSQQLADALVARIEAHGGEVLRGSQVTSIATSGRHVTGVELAGGEFLPADHVISSIHPTVTLDLVAHSPRIKKVHRTRLEALENSCSIVSVYLIMKPGAMPYLNRNYYIHSDRDTWNTTYDLATDTPRAVLVGMQAAQRDQNHAKVVSLLCPVEWDMFAPWAHTVPNRRGEEYLALKHHLAERVVEFVSRRFPEIGRGVEHVVTTSPLSWRDHTSTPLGSAYGIVKDWRSPLTTLMPVDTRFDNLLLTGQSINVHGALGVSVTAALTCSRLLGEEYVAKQIGNA